MSEKNDHVQAIDTDLFLTAFNMIAIDSVLLDQDEDGEPTVDEGKMVQLQLRGDRVERGVSYSSLFAFNMPFCAAQWFVKNMTRDLDALMVRVIEEEGGGKGE